MHSPSRVHLPSGRVLALQAEEGILAHPRRAAEPLFSELMGLVATGALTLREGRLPVDLGALELRDFHALRAIATRLGWISEEPVEIACRNCGESIAHAPCSTFELGPFVDGELVDEELDRTLDLASAHPIPPAPLAGGRQAHDVSLTRVTVATAAPLHRALRRRRFKITPPVVGAMGITALGEERDPVRMAAALQACSDRTWEAVGDLFLQAHYPARLGSVVTCPRCGARNDVDAPYDREFEPASAGPLPEGILDPARVAATASASARSGRRDASNSEQAPRSNGEPSRSPPRFPHLDEFDRRARAFFEARAGGEAGLVLAIDSGVPACDDGGEPLLGSYVPPGGDPSAPVGLAEVTVYYRSFLAMWREDGPYDWAAELETTVEHELEHHGGWRTGHDPMDDEERSEIEREHARRVGHRVAARSSAVALIADVRDFVVHTWPIWLIVGAVSAGLSVCGR